MFPLINQGVDSTLEPAYFSDLKRLTEVEINPALNQQLILPEDGYDGFSKVTVNKVTASIDSNIIPNNIKEGVSILGVEGTCPPPAPKPLIYGFRVDPQNVSYVTYIENAIGMTPAGLVQGDFDYGSWANAFFMPRPCMVGFDGEVKYYLKPNDFTKKLDGTPSHNDDLNYPGNVMIEFPKIWYKFVSRPKQGFGEFYCSNVKVDDSYHCWCNINAENEETDHFYLGAYHGCTYDGRMRSIAGLNLKHYPATEYTSIYHYSVGSTVNYQGKAYKCIEDQPAGDFDPDKWEQFAYNDACSPRHEIQAIMNSYNTVKNEWYISIWADRMLLSALLILMSKNADTGSAFGRGVIPRYSGVQETYTTGYMDKVGMFAGNNSDTDHPVKVFGIENFWGMIRQWTAGFTAPDDVGGGYLYKLTWGTADGSKATSYNDDGTDYLEANVGATIPMQGWLQHMAFGPWGMVPASVVENVEDSKWHEYIYIPRLWGYLMTNVAYVDSNRTGGGALAMTAFTDWTNASIGWSFFLSYKPINSSENE